MSESSFLPIELYGNILQYVPTHDLAIACLASATLQREAETILYRAITLDCRSSHARILCWCAAINGSSRRAETVHTLSVPALIAIHVQDTKSGDILEASLSSALNKLVNLKQLTLKQNRFRAGPDQVHLPSINPSSIGLFPFRLQDLSGDFIAFTSDDLWRFLSTQPDIRSWAIGSPAVECLHQLSRSILPKLSGVHLPNCKELKFLAPRPIERLSVHLFVIGDGERDNVLIRSLDLFKNTLQHLTCYVEGSGELEDWKAADFIRSVAKQVPLLKSLTYYKNSDPTARSVNKSEILDAVSQFCSIEALHFDLVLSRPGNNRDDCDEIAKQFISSSPSLRRISFRHHAYFFPRLCYTRSKDDGVEFTIWDPFSASSSS